MCQCTNLKEFMTIQIKIIEDNIDGHKWLRHIEDRDQAIIDFIEHYAWIMREMYCKYMCPKKGECNVETNKS